MITCHIKFCAFIVRSVCPGSNGVTFDTPNSYNYTPNNVGDISQITSMKFTVDANNDARVFIGADATPQVVISMG